MIWSKIIRQELTVNEKDSNEIKNKKKELNSFLLEGNFILNRKFEDMNKNEDNQNYLKAKIFIKNIYRTINKKIYLNLFFAFSKLKNILFINTKTEEILDSIKSKINNISHLLEIVKKHKKRKIVLTKRKAFLRWKIKANYNISKEMITKMLIQQPIKLSYIYRLKKIVEDIEYQRNLKFLNFVAQISIFLNKSILRRDFELKKKSFEKIQFYCMGHEEKEKINKMSKFIHLINKRKMIQSEEIFDEVCLKNPFRIFSKNILKASIIKENIVLDKLCDFVKLQKCKLVYKFINSLKKKMVKNSKEAFDHLESPIVMIVQKLNKKRKIIQKFYLKTLKNNILTEELRENELNSLFKKIQNFFIKKKFKKAFQVLKANSDTYNLPELLVKLQHEKTAKCLKAFFEKLCDNSSEIENKLKLKLIRKLEKSQNLKIYQVFKEMKNPIIKKNQSQVFICRKFAISAYFSKLAVLTKLMNYSKNLNKDKNKISFDLLKNAQKIKLLEIFYKLRENSKVYEIAEKNILRNFFFNQNKKMKEIFFALKNFNLEFKQKQSRIEDFHSKLKKSKIEYNTKTTMNSLINDNSDSETNIKKPEFSFFESVLNYSCIVQNKKPKKLEKGNFNFDLKKKEEGVEKFQTLFANYLQKVFNDNNDINKLGGYFKIENEKVKLQIKKNLFFCLNRLFLNKKNGFFILIKKKSGENCQKISLLFSLKKLFRNKKHFYWNLFQNNLEKDNRKKYFLNLFANRLLEKYRLKKIRAYRKLRYPEEERDTKIQALNRIQNFNKKIRDKNLSLAFKKLSLNSPLLVSRIFYKMRKLLLKKNYNNLEENFLLLKACKSKEFQQYLKNPEYLIKLKNLVLKQQKNQNLIAQTLKPPCYLILKLNANLLNEKNKTDLDNFLYLFRRLPSSLLILKKIELKLFDYKIYTKNTEKSNLELEYKILEQRLIEIVKEKLELVKKLNENNFDLTKQSEDVYKALDTLKDQNKFYQNEMDKIIEEKQKMEKELNELPRRISIANSIHFSNNEMAEALKREILGIENQLSNFNEDKTKRKTRLNDLVKDKNILNEELENLKQTNKKFLKDIEINYNLIHDLEEKNILLQGSSASIDIFINEIQDLRTKIDLLYSKEAKEEQKKKDLNNEKIQFLDLKNKLNKYKNDVSSQNEELKKNNLNLKLQNSEHHEFISNDLKRNDYENQIKELEEKNLELKAYMDSDQVKSLLQKKRALEKGENFYFENEVSSQKNILNEENQFNLNLEEKTKRNLLNLDGEYYNENEEILNKNMFNQQGESYVKAKGNSRRNLLNKEGEYYADLEGNSQRSLLNQEGEFFVDEEEKSRRNLQNKEGESYMNGEENSQRNLSNKEVDYNLDEEQNFQRNFTNKEGYYINEEKISQRNQFNKRDEYNINGLKEYSLKKKLLNPDRTSCIEVESSSSKRNTVNNDQETYFKNESNSKRNIQNKDGTLGFENEITSKRNILNKGESQYFENETTSKKNILNNDEDYLFENENNSKRNLLNAGKNFSEFEVSIEKDLKNFGNYDEIQKTFKIFPKNIEEEFQEIELKKRELNKNLEELRKLKSLFKNIPETNNQLKNPNFLEENEKAIIDNDLKLLENNHLLNKNENELNNVIEKIFNQEEILKGLTKDKEFAEIELSQKEGELKKLQIMLKKSGNSQENERKIDLLEKEINLMKLDLKDNINDILQFEENYKNNIHQTEKNELKISELQIKMKGLNNALNQKKVLFLELQEEIQKGFQNNEVKNNTKIEENSKRIKLIQDVSLLNTKLNELNEYLVENIANKNKNQELLKEKNEIINKNKEELNQNKYVLVKILSEVHNFSDDYNLQLERNKLNEDYLNKNIKQIQQQEILLERNCEQVQILQEILERMNNMPRILESRSIQVNDRIKSRLFLLKNFLLKTRRIYLKRVNSFFEKIRLKYKKNELEINLFHPLIKYSKKVMVCKDTQIEQDNSKIDKKQFGLILLDFFVKKKNFSFFETFKQNITIQVKRQNLRSLIKWSWVSKLSKDSKIKNSYIKFKEVLFDLSYFLRKKSLKNLSFAFKNLSLQYLLDKLKHRNRIVTNLFSFAIKYEKKKITHYVKTWQSKRKINPWRQKIIDLLLKKTPLSIIPQKVIWKMKSYPKQKYYLDPIKLVAAINLKNFLKKKIEGLKIQALLAIECMQNIEVDYGTGLYFTNDEYGTTMTVDSQIMNKNIAPIEMLPEHQTNDKENKNVVIKIGDGSEIYEDEDSKLSGESSHRDVPVIRISTGFKYSMNSHRRLSIKSRHKNVIKLFMNKLKKKKFHFFHKLKSFSLLRTGIRNEQIYEEKLKTEANKKMNQMNMLIKMLINENIRSKQDLNEKLFLIQNLKNDIFESQHNRVFLKNHYMWIFLRNINDIFEKNYVLEVKYAFFTLSAN